MANKTEKLPQIRVTEEQKSLIYSMASSENKKISEFVLDKLFNSDLNLNDPKHLELSLLKLMNFYENARDLQSKVGDKFKYTQKINNLKDILCDLKKIDNFGRV